MILGNEEKLKLLKQILIFTELDEDDLIEVAELLNTEFMQAGKVVFSQDEDSDSVFIIRHGEVGITSRDKDGREKIFANYSAGDMFGEDDLVDNGFRSTTATAITDTELYYFSDDEFNWIRENFPGVDDYLAASSRSHETIKKLKMDWMVDEENIHLILKRHPISMIVEIVGIAFLVSLVLTITIALITFLEDERVITLLSAGSAGVITLIGLVTGFWSYIEWRNDYFFVTNLRVVWRERILLRSSSRQEVPLRTIQSLSVLTSNVFSRMIHIGDINIRTFNSEMMLVDVNQPYLMKNMIEALLHKEKSKSFQSEQTAIRRTIRRQLGYEEAEAADDAPAVSDSTTQIDRQGFSFFKTRMVEDDAITYRKHWWVFFKRAWKPTTLFIVSTALFAYYSTAITTSFGVSFLISIFFFPFCMLVWLVYQYEDWRNDIYRVSRDRIIDRDKKPLGKESFRSAPIKNIQSVGHEVPNTIGLILNVGNVNINVGEETLTFDGVHNPALVHQDISTAMEALEAEEEHIRSKQEHERMAAWLEIYHEETKGENDNGPVYKTP